MFFVHTTPEKCENATLIGQKLGQQGNEMILITSSFSQDSIFRPHENEKPLSFSNASSLKSVFEKLRFRNGLV